MKAPIQIADLWQLLLRLLFPHHHRKVTTTVVGIGALLLLDGYLLQGLIAWLAQIMLAKFTGATPPTFADASADGSIVAGVALIGMALIYSVLVLIIETSEARSLREDTARASAEVAFAGQNVLRRDKRLYEDFLTDFRTGGALEYFVCEHNFGGSWHSNRSNLLDDFVIKWRAPERAYQSPEIGDAFIKLLDSMRQLNNHLNAHSGPLRANASLSGILDPSIHHDFDMPNHIDRAISEANALGTVVRDQRREFIQMAEKHFATLPADQN